VATAPKQETESRLVYQSIEADDSMAFLARHEINAFAEYVLRDEKTREPIKQAPHHIRMHEMFDQSRRVAIWGHVESGKDLAADTPIPTPTGWARNGDLKDGDTVIGGDGRPCTVVKAHPFIEKPNLFRVEFDDGSHLVAGAEHQWFAGHYLDFVTNRPPPSAKHSGDGELCACGCGLRAKEGKRYIHNHHGRTGRSQDNPWQVVTTQEMLNRGVKFEAASGPGNTWRLQLTEPVQYPEADLPVPPYVLGAWLGDGTTRSTQLTFHRVDEETWRRCIALVGGSFIPRPQKPGSDTMRASMGRCVGGRNVVAEGLRRLGIFRGKRVPAQYLRASVEQRRELLAGLLDTDGSVGRTGRVEFSNSNESIARGMLELARSLGYKATLREREAKLYGRVTGTSYRVCFTPRDHVFRLQRKRDAQVFAGEKNRADYKFITAIEPLPPQPSRCITVDSPDSTYLAGDAYTVTHNTQQAVARILFTMGRDPSTRGLVMSATDAGARKIIDLVRDYIERSEELHKVFPNLKRGKLWTQSRITMVRDSFSKDPSVQGIGLKGDIIGSRLDWAVIDDPLTLDNTTTPGRRNEVVKRIDAILESRLSKDAWVIALVNGWHPHDWFHRVEKHKSWLTVRMPAEDKKGRPTWPVRWDRKRLDQKKADLVLPQEYARQMLCLARSDEDSRFKEANILKCYRRGDGMRLISSIEELKIVKPGLWELFEEGLCFVYTGVDLAVQKHAGADETALFTILVDPKGYRWVLSILAGKLSGPEIVELIKLTARRFRSIVRVENNACFPPGTKVLTRAGYVPIEHVNVGDEVWTHAGRWRRVVEMVEGTSRTLATVKAAGCPPVRCSSNHWFWMRRAGRTPGRSGGHHRPVGDPAWVSAPLADEPGYIGLSVPKWPAVPAELKLPAIRGKTERTVTVDEDLALLLGLFMAEGHATERQVFWTLAAHETHLLDHIEKVVKRLVPGAACSRRRRDGTARIWVSSTQLARALRPFGKSEAKAPPREMFGWPLPARMAMVRGWLMGDGCLRVNNAKTAWPRPFLSGASISRNWMLFAKTTLLEAGHRPTLTPGTRQGQTTFGDRVVRRQLIYTLALNAEDTARLRAAMMSGVEAEHWPPVEAPSRRSNSQVVLDESGAWARMRSPRGGPFEQYGGPVFNLVVEEDESYVVEGMVVHNAQDYIRQFCTEDDTFPIWPHTTGRNKVHPEFGIESIHGEMAAGKWVVPNHAGELEAEVSAWVSEMLYYDPKAHTGDRLIASWLAREQAAMVERGGTEPPELEVRVLG
jgi:hypothetical protein